MFTPPTEVGAVCAAFTSLFTRPSWRRAQALLGGALLAPSNHVLTAALRALGLAGDAAGFQNYHRLLNRARWSAREAAGILLRLLVTAFVPNGPLILGLDETVERRRGPRTQDPGAGDLSGCGTLQPRMFSKDRRSALLEPAPARTDPPGQAGVGTALFDRALSLRTLPCLHAEGSPAQAAGRAGTRTPSARCAAGCRVAL